MYYDYSEVDIVMTLKLILWLHWGWYYNYSEVDIMITLRSILWLHWGWYYDYSEVDSDGDEIPDEEDEESRKYYGYRVWYSLEIHVKPSPPERIMAVECCCQVRNCQNMY